MEEAYRRWAETPKDFPWPKQDVQDIGNTVIRRLAAKGVQFQRFLVLGIALERALGSINQLGPLLFPLITEAEVRLSGTRGLPGGVPRVVRQSDYYEVTGVVDVIAANQLAPAAAGNPLAAEMAAAGAGVEVIVDYKGMRRPASNDPANETWKHHEWQVLTYAWLRARQTGSLTVRGALLLYLNEISPGTEDMDQLHLEVVKSTPAVTEVLPNDEDLEALRRWPEDKKEWARRLREWEPQVREWWRTGKDRGELFSSFPSLPRPLSLDFLRRRATRVIKVDEAAIERSLASFDDVVEEIEMSVVNEVATGRLIANWKPVPRDESCTICDFNNFCPAPGNRYRGAPTAP